MIGSPFGFYFVPTLDEYYIIVYDIQECNICNFEKGVSIC